ncbi:MAG: substrate-binding domain-containing protein [Luteolibacter sp.]
MNTTSKRCRVLVLLGWHDERVLRALVRHARQARWHMETRHFFDETLPQGWTGDGMLVSNPARPNLLRFMVSQAPRQPTVLLERNLPLRLKFAAHVHEDNKAAGRLAAEHLLAMGHKHFVWWTSQSGPVSEERLAGFREVLAQAGLDCTPLHYQSGGPRGEWLRRRTWLRKQLSKLPRPAALFAMDDQLAAEAVEMCQACGLDVPGDVAVVGVGNLELASETSPVPITSVDLDEEQIALTGARMLDRLMDGGKAPATAVVIPPKGLVVRQSSEGLAVTHPVMLRTIEHLRGNLADPFDIHRVAATAGVSARTLYHLFRSELRCTPVDFLQRERLARAKAMLGDGESRIHELVHACGFGTARTMNRLFLSHEGCSPKEWRSQTQ